MLASSLRFGDDRRHPAGGGEQRGGLGADDLEIMVFVGVDLALGGQLVDLALGDHRGGVAEDLEHLEAAVLDHQLERAAEQEIADQHARRIAPDEVGGALAAAQARAVDDVVVQQRRGVDELDRGGELVMARARIAEQRRAQASVSIGRMRLPPPAIRWPASSGISATLLCMRSRMTALTPFMSAATSAISASSDGARWSLSVMDCSGHGAALAGRRRFS